MHMRGRHVFVERLDGIVKIYFDEIASASYRTQPRVIIPSRKSKGKKKRNYKRQL